MESRDRIMVTVGYRMLTDSLELLKEGDVSFADTSGIE
jgi:hypothetical protein